MKRMDLMKLSVNHATLDWSEIGRRVRQQTMRAVTIHFVEMGSAAMDGNPERQPELQRDRYTS